MNLNLLISFLLFINICFSAEILNRDSLANQARNILKTANRYWYEDKDKAIEFYNKTIDLAEKANLSDVAEKAFEGLGSIYFEKKEYKKAIAQYNIAIKIGKSRQSNKINKWQEYVAECLYNLRKFNAALDTLTIAEKISIEKHDMNVLVRIYDLRARIYYVLSLYSLSEIALKKAIKHKSSTSSQRLVGRFYERLGDLAMERGRYKLAIKYYIQSLNNIYSKHKTDFVKELKSYIYERVGDAHSSQDNYRLAENYYLKSFELAKSIYHKRRTRTALIALMELSYKQNKYNDFFNYYSQIESLNLNIGFNGENFLLKGNVFYELDQIDSAEIYYKKALTIIEGNQSGIQVSDLRMSILSTKANYFNRLARLYKRKIKEEGSGFTQIDSLFKYLNSARSRSLYERKVARTSRIKTPYDEAIKELQKFQRQIRFGETFNETEQNIKLNSLKYDLVASRIENLKEQIAGHNIISLQQFQSYLEKTNSTSLIYSLNSYEQYALVIDKNSLKIVDLDINIELLKERIELLLNKAFFQKNSDGNTFNTKIAYELYQDLWKPLEEETKLAKNLIIIPDTPILALPFDILLTKEDTVNNYSFYDAPSYVGNLLVNKHNISILPSANLTGAFKPLENEETLIFANSIFSAKTNSVENRWAFQPLVFSKLEATKVKAITNARILEKRHSSESEFKKQVENKNIIHLATHAFVDTVFDLFSGLAFSTIDSSDDDGLLMGYEIEQLQLNCDLVTLSACESGRGRVLSGEGVLGLPRQFFNAGARSTLMSLWTVDDRLASELMPLFYENLLNKNQLKNEALGNAKRSIIKNYQTSANGIYYANPFFWASFTLYGDVENNSVVNSESKNLVYIGLIIIFLFSVIIFARKKYFF